MIKEVILVDNEDVQVGTMSKLACHQKGILHRAFSVFIFNSKGELLLQQRALDKYHSAGLWSNTCCSHPAPGESTLDAARRRLKEEMGMVCNLNAVFSFVYKAVFDNGLTEHEFDHVYFGYSDLLPVINKEEVNEWRYCSIAELKKEIQENPSHYSEWLKDCLDKVVQYRNP
jgi:isopentenyl-diphosphate Delta-isomerase